MELPSIDLVNDSLSAIEDAGGDPTQPTQIIDQVTGTVIAIAQRQDGQTVVNVPTTSTRSIAGVFQSVTGFIDSLAGTITNIGTQLQRTGNAIKGGAAGAQAGYNAPTNMTPYLIGGAALLALVAINSMGPRRR